MTTHELTRFRPGDPAESIIDALATAGAVIIDDLVSPEAIETLTAEVQPHIDRADPDMEHLNDTMATFFGGVRNVTGLASKSPTFVDAVLLHPVLLAAAEAVIGPNCASFNLNVAHLMVRESGAQRQWLHRDENVWSFLPRPHAEVELSSVIALVDFTKENGATVVAPGSQHWEPGREPEEHELVAAEMPAGSAVLYLGSTIHAGGTNISPHGRPGIHLSYVAGWLRPEENNTLATPVEIARRLPLRAQELIGYDVHDAIPHGGGYLGCVDLGRPTDLLAAASGS